MNLTELVTADRCIISTEHSVQGSISELSSLVADDGGVSDAQALKEALLARESIMSTGIGLGVAIPHAKIPTVERFILGVSKLQKPIDWKSLDHQAVDIVFLIAGPENAQNQYLSILATLTLYLKNAEFRARLRAAKSSDELYSVIAEV